MQEEKSTLTDVNRQVWMLFWVLLHPDDTMDKVINA